MPYPGERASKVAHQHIVEHPDVHAFLDQCDYLREPRAQAPAEYISPFVTAVVSTERRPLMVAAFDGSQHESSVDDKLLPSTRVGYSQIGCVLLDMERFVHLRDGARVDPFRVAKLEEGTKPLVFTVPSSNLRWAGSADVRLGFRRAVDQHFRSARTQILPGDPRSTLQGTLFYLASLRAGPLATGDPSRLLLHRCPNHGCNAHGLEVLDQDVEQRCPECGGPLFASDCLRVWEAVEDNQSNAEALGRLTMALEHLLFAHSLRCLHSEYAETVSRMAFFIDGPLAVFGNAAWLSRCILALVFDVCADLRRKGLPSPLIIGIQKTGQVVDYVHMLDRHLAQARVLAVSDEYRYRYIKATDDVTGGFGSETYYGQDVIFKSHSGRCFVFDLPYPFRDRTDPSWQLRAFDTSNYPDLPAALGLIEAMESDLYEDATIPTVLAHKYTAISLVPGSFILDQLTRKALGADRAQR